MLILPAVLLVFSADVARADDPYRIILNGVYFVRPAVRAGCT